MMALGLTSSPIIVALIGLGFILNSFQIVCNCYIGCTRIMVAQGLDGLLPDWFSRVNPKWKTPVNAHVIYFLAAVRSSSLSTRSPTGAPSGRSASRSPMAW